VLVIYILVGYYFHYGHRILVACRSRTGVFKVSTNFFLSVFLPTVVHGIYSGCTGHIVGEMEKMCYIELHGVADIKLILRSSLNIAENSAENAEPRVDAVHKNELVSIRQFNESILELNRMLAGEGVSSLHCKQSYSIHSRYCEVTWKGLILPL
jgi:hypothetical protein